MQSTIREHKDRTGGYFNSYNIHKVNTREYSVGSSFSSIVSLTKLAVMDIFSSVIIFHSRAPKTHSTKMAENFPCIAI